MANKQNDIDGFTPLSSILNHIVTLLAKDARRVLKENGIPLTYNQFYMLAILARLQPTNQHRLASVLRQSDAAVSRSVTKLVQDGYAVVLVNPQHLRKNAVSLTDKGLRTMRQALGILEASFTDDLQHTVIDQARYYDDSVKIRDYLEQRYGETTTN